MHRFTRVASIVVPLVIAAGDIGAQTCMGRPAFSTGRVQLAALAQFGDHATVFGGDISVGGDRTLFARAGIARETSEAGGFGNDPAGMVAGGAFGFQISAGSAGRAQLCPVASAQWGRLEVADNVNLERTQFQAGVMFGVARPPGTGLHVVPFGGLAFAQLSRDARVDDLPDISFGSDTYFPLTIGVGLHFKRSFALVSDVTIPIDLGDGDPSVAIRAVFPIGGR